MCSQAAGAAEATGAVFIRTDKGLFSAMDALVHLQVALAEEPLAAPFLRADNRQGRRMDAPVPLHVTLV